MASSQSQMIIRKYDVFVSFRGKDTRNGFISHLCAALQRKSIITFRDDKNLKKGEGIAPELLQAIEGSQVFIVVFSKNYASSTWCLRELAKIVDCIKVSGGKHVLPIFYDVDPSDVRKQSGNFEKAFFQHEERFKDDLEMVQRWKEALTQVANLSGWDIHNKQEHGEIEKIVKEVASILGRKCLGLGDNLVGMDSRVKQLQKLLVLGMHEVVQVVGICGMGGIGKSTLATVLYDKVSRQFDACCFIDDVSKIYRVYGAIGVQKQFLCQILNEENLEICNLYEATNLIRARLHHVKAFIVLDNVDKVEQLEELAVKREWLGGGSRIIIISRDRHILKKQGVDEVYNVQLLNWDNSHQLFIKNAFKCDNIMRDYKELTHMLKYANGSYEELTHKVLKYANGLPLAIKVLSSFLFGRDVFEWKSALARLRESPNKNIMDVLRISFDGLEEMEKEIFLDIACFFDGNNEIYVNEVLDFRGFFPDVGIRVLIDKSLITREQGIISMHDLLKELGRSIVREKSPKEPRKWSRLWNYKDLHNVMQDTMAAENLEAIVLQQYPMKIPEETIRANALSQMSHLKLLILWNVNFSGCLHYLSNELGYLCWDEYPFTCLPSSFQPDKLVELILPHSNIKHLWKGTKSLLNLRCMDLSHSKNLIKMPDFREVPNLERLNLEGCIKLVRIDQSVGLLRKLAFLNLKNCKNLVSIPINIMGLSCLEVLNLSGCSKLNQLFKKPRHGKHLKMLDTSETASHSQSTSSICKMLMLPIHVFSHKRVEEPVGLLLPSLPNFPCLRDLDLSFCNLRQVPDAIGWLRCLECLDLGGNNFVRLPSSIKELFKLVCLNLAHCKQLKHFPELSSYIDLPVRHRTRGLHIFNCPNLGEIERCWSMAFSWMIRLIQELNQEHSFWIEGLDIVIPGSEIPGWFNNQSVGSSISIDLSPIMHNNDYIGIACCAVCGPIDDPIDSSNFEGMRSPTMGFRIGIGCYGIPINASRNRVNIDIIMPKSDNVWIVYMPWQVLNFMIRKRTRDLDGIQMVTLMIEKPQHLPLEVKSCGFRWVFKQDLEQFYPTMVRSGSNNNSSILIDDSIHSSVQKQETG